MSNIKYQISSVVIKICGVTTPEDALMCAEAGANLLGLNFYTKSPRYIELGKARRIVEALHSELGSGCPLLIGVFVNTEASEIARLIDAVGLDAAQLSGDEGPDVQAALSKRGIKAIRPRDVREAVDMAAAFTNHAPEDNRLPALMIDAYHPALYGGTGQQTSTDIALAAKEAVPRLMLAGGLKPENVAEQVRLIQPWGVDVASGVEAGQPGIKDIERVRVFVEAVKQA